MYGDVVLGVQKRPDEDHEPFEVAIETLKHERYHKDVEDTALTADDLQELVRRFKALVKARAGRDFPASPWDQLMGAVGAVFGSWMNDRAIVYRRKYNIPTEWGTAVNVQAMVYGNTGDQSGSGVAFTRNPANGTKEFYGEFLINAQGEDVVAGVRTPEPVAQLKNHLPKAYHELERIRQTLEKHFKDVQDFEFTIEDGVALHAPDAQRQAHGHGRAQVLDGHVQGEAHRLEDRGDAQPGGSARSAAGAGVRRGRSREGRGHRDGPARGPRRGVRSDLLQRRSRGGRGGPEGTGPARPRRDVARRPPRHDRGGRHPHGARRRVVARRPGGEADGQGLRLRRGRARSGLSGAHRQGRRPDIQGRRLAVDRRHGREGLCRARRDRAVRDRGGARRRRRGGEEDREVQELPAADEVVRSGDAHGRCGPTPTRRSRRGTPSRSAPSASASAGPSTCSSRATASTPCAR